MLLCSKFILKDFSHLNINKFAQSKENQNSTLEAILGGWGHKQWQNENKKVEVVHKTI